MVSLERINDRKILGVSTYYPQCIWILPTGKQTYRKPMEDFQILSHLFTRWHQQGALKDIELYRGNLQNYITIQNYSNHSYHWHPKHMYNQNTAFPAIQYSHLLFSINFRLANFFSISTQIFLYISTKILNLSREHIWEMRFLHNPVICHISVIYHYRYNIW